MRCAECKWWDEKRYEWYNKARPCQVNGEFFVGGGDNNDGLYTEPNFWCKHFVECTANTAEGAKLCSCGYVADVSDSTEEDSTDDLNIPRGWNQRRLQ